jgi:uncharacterized protein (DUF305 family)
MRNYVQVLGLAMAVAAVGSLSAPRAATAADSMMMKMDCKSAGSMMATMTPPPMAMKPSMPLDKEFMSMMVAHDKMAMSMAKMESQCGKDPKTRAMAAKMAEELQLEINRMLPYL